MNSIQVRQPAQDRSSGLTNIIDILGRPNIVVMNQFQERFKIRLVPVNASALLNVQEAPHARHA